MQRTTGARTSCHALHKENVWKGIFGELEVVAEIQTEVMAIVGDTYVIRFALEFLVLVHYDYIKVPYAVA